ncbi:hypothetical protein LCGC14_0607600 [marine sediment metagenome]|uniref:Uncharacterized protein n=1 Tax=marine sediment metagenome TaxID=412755 RepID=A0A0F9UH32_9ZZZZ
MARMRKLDPKKTAFDDKLLTEKALTKQRHRSRDEVVRAIWACGGIISDAARMLGYAGQSGLRYRIRDDVELQEMITEARETMKDIAESKLKDALFAGEQWAVTYYLNNQARDRGYGREGININMQQNTLTAINLESYSDKELLQLEKLLAKAPADGTVDA